MDRYFLSLVNKLTIEEIEVLNHLTKRNANNRFSARTKKELHEETKFTEAKFRKILYRLEAINFLEIVAGNREHLVFVTEYGQEAIQQIFERGNV